jgi:hypothetical protein
MKMNHLLALALALGLTAGSVSAQNDGPPDQQGPPPAGDGAPPDGPPPGDGPAGRHHRPPPFMAALDTNKDGVLSADEIANAAKALLTLDKDGDGKITMEEFLGPPPGPRPGGPDGDKTGGPSGDQPPRRPRDNDQGGPGSQDKTHPHPVPPIFAALDTNGDGVLSADEIANAPKSLLTLDKNGDGKLTIDELRPPHRQPPGGSNSNN